MICCSRRLRENGVGGGGGSNTPSPTLLRGLYRFSTSSHCWIFFVDLSRHLLVIVVLVVMIVGWYEATTGIVTTMNMPMTYHQLLHHNIIVISGVRKWWWLLRSQYDFTGIILIFSWDVLVCIVAIYIYDCMVSPLSLLRSRQICHCHTHNEQRSTSEKTWQHIFYLNYLAFYFYKTWVVRFLLPLLLKYVKTYTWQTSRRQTTATSMGAETTRGIGLRLITPSVLTS